MSCPPTDYLFCQTRRILPNMSCCQRKPTLGYWDLRGLGQPIRNLLAYAGVEFTDKLYHCGPNFDRTEWLKDKFTLGLDFPNLPYYFEGSVKLSQSLAILRYLGHKHNLGGANQEEKIRVAMLEQQLTDLNGAMARLVYGDDCDKLKPDFLKQLPDSLKQLDTFLGDRQFAAGDNLSYVDFMFYEYLVKLKVMLPDLFKQFARFNAYVERIESLPRLSDFLKKQKPGLFFAPLAKWNGQY